MKVSRKFLVDRLCEDKYLSGNGQNISLDLEGPNGNIIKVNVLVHFELDKNDISFDYNYGDINSTHNDYEMNFANFYYDIKSYGLKNSTDRQIENEDEDYKKITFLGGWKDREELDDYITEKAQEYIMNHLSEFE